MNERDEDLPLSTELRLKAQSGEGASITDLPIPVMQALYHEITGRSETIEKKYSDHFLIHHESVAQLIHKLVQTIGQYNTQAADAQFKVSLKEDSAQSYSSLVKFQQLDRSRLEKVRNIEVTFSFLLSTPGANKYQNYRLTIIFGLLSYLRICRI